MALSSNIIVVGNLTRDPELQFSQSGKEYTRFGIAVNYRVKKGDDWEDKPSFYEVTAFDSLAANAAGSLYKGDRVVVTGRVEINNYTNKDGDDKTSVGIVADEIGASLRWANVAITRNERPGGGRGETF